MGITGLLPFLEKASKRTNVSEFAGGVAAIDSYCWLHKGVFSCAEKLIMGQSTDAYVHYCMKFIHMLLSHKIKPILVFDGRHLPAKAQTEAKRRETREANRRKAIELMRMGQHSEARNLIRRSIDITHEMALELIKQCQKMNIDCIVAPYEADAQLAYLNINGIADVVITEDSDLTLFGCKRVFFKLDINGNGLLVSQEQLYLAMDTRVEHFSMDDFLYMCILSGCDYLPSLPGIGLCKARKFIKANTDCDIHRALTRLGSYLNMKSITVTQEYRDLFILAVITFKHQLVFCPLRRKQVRLNPPMSDITEEQLHYAGIEVNSDIALQLAYGNRDPFTLEILHNFDPDKAENQVTKSNTWGYRTESFQHISIWSKDYKLAQRQLQTSTEKKKLIKQETMISEGPMNMHTKRIKRVCLMKPDDNFECDQLNKKEILEIYESKNITDVKNNLEANTGTFDEDEVSPILNRKRNPFSKQPSNTETSPSLLCNSKSRIRGRHVMRIRRTIINEESITESKFFSKVSDKTNDVMTIDHRASLPSNSSESISDKENIQLEKSNETNNINLQVLTIADEVKTDLHPMNINEEHNTSITSDECKNDEFLHTTSNCDLGKLHLDISINESPIKENNMALSEFDADSHFLIQQEDISTLNNSFFKQYDTKVPAQSNKMKQKKNVNSKRSTTNSTRRSQQVRSVQRQQSLLSKFGFEKKKLA